MKVRKIDNNGDWTFGSGRDGYIKDNDAVLQNIVTRLRSVKGDWFLDVEAGIDWMGLLGAKDTKQLIIDEVSRIVLSTEFVTSIDNIELTLNEDRHAIIALTVSTVFNVLNDLEVTI